MSNTESTTRSHSGASGIRRLLSDKYSRSAWLICVGLVPLFVCGGLRYLNEIMFVGVLFAAIGAIISFANPYAGLILFTASLYLRIEESVPDIAGLHYSLLLALCSLLGLVIQWIVGSYKPVNSPMLATMFGFAIIGSISGGLTGHAIQATMDFARLFIIALLILNLVRTPENYTSFVSSLIIATVYIAGFSIFEFFQGVVKFDQGLARSMSTGIFSDPNDLAATIDAGFALVMMRILSSRGWTKVGYSATAVLLLYAEFLSGSRGGLLALAVVVVGSVTFFIPRNLMLSAAAFVGIAAIIVAAPGHMTDFNSQESSANSRFQAWHDGLGAFRQSPVIGIGYNKFTDLTDGIVAHNSVVQCFTELGFSGLFFWIGCIYFAYRRPEPTGTEVNFEAYSEVTGARLALAGYLTASYFISRTYQPVHCILVCLPMAQQIAYAGPRQLRFYKQNEAWRAAQNIFVASFLSILVVWAMTAVLR